MYEACSEDGEDEAGDELEEDAVQPEVEGERQLTVQPPVVDDQPIFLHGHI